MLFSSAIAPLPSFPVPCNNSLLNLGFIILIRGFILLLYMNVSYIIFYKVSISYQTSYIGVLNLSSYHMLRLFEMAQTYNLSSSNLTLYIPFCEYTYFNYHSPIDRHLNSF